MEETNVIIDEPHRMPDGDMPGWVCAIGGYEMLLHAEDHGPAQQWLMQFGMRAHKRAHHGFAGMVQRLRAAHYFGFAWWGPPDGWGDPWKNVTTGRVRASGEPESWSDALFTEMVRRSRDPVFRGLLLRDRAYGASLEKHIMAQAKEGLPHGHSG